MVISSIEKAVGLTQAGRAGAVVTNPIQKAILTEAGFKHPGHTEFLAHLAAPQAKSDVDRGVKPKGFDR